MSIQLQARMSALEAEVKDLRKVVGELVAILSEAEPKGPANGQAGYPVLNAQGPRQMCPKCGEKPAYHFHVQHCTGKKAAQ